MLYDFSNNYNFDMANDSSIVVIKYLLQITFNNIKDLTREMGGVGLILLCTRLYIMSPITFNRAHPLYLRTATTHNSVLSRINMSGSDGLAYSARGLGA